MVDEFDFEFVMVVQNGFVDIDYVQLFEVFGYVLLNYQYQVNSFCFGGKFYWQVGDMWLQDCIVGLVFEYVYVGGVVCVDVLYVLFVGGVEFEVGEDVFGGFYFVVVGGWYIDELGVVVVGYELDGGYVDE